jgi:ATP-dependent Lon protease
MTEQLVLDDLDRKLAGAFPGRVVRKDLVKRLKVGFSIPVYVLEYLLGKYCESADTTEIEERLKMLKRSIAKRIVRAMERN